MPVQQIPIFTIGYGNRSLDDFVALLKQHDIAYLLDVRSAPTSRHQPAFAREPLAMALQQHGIRYLFLGHQLGGRPGDPACTVEGAVDYAAVQALPAYQQGIERVHNAFRQQQRVALMCGELRPEACHRTHLIGASLAQRGVPVAHIDETGALQAHAAVLARAPVLQPPPPPLEPDDDFWFPPDPGPPPDYPPDYFADMPAGPPVSLSLPSEPLPPLNGPAEALKRIFGYDAFRPLQAEIIANVLDRRDTLVIMPTGGGKSLCYQIPALLFDGLTVVVSPLIALMQDQVSQLQAAGVPAVFLNSSLLPAEYGATVQAVRQGAIKLLYVAPETLLKPETMQLLADSRLACLAIDEAHCISQWGHDFRPEYRQLTAVRQRLPGVVCIALTATATPRVQQDIRQSLSLQETNTFVASFDRPNLFLEVAPKTDTLRQVLAFLAAHPEQSGIIYCNTRKTVDALSEALTGRGLSLRPYHAGLDAGTRSQNQTAFIRDDVQIMVATVAFGMGIDKPDVRFVLHVDLPKNIEQYYQQIGRAGRDGLRADCLLLYSVGDVVTNRYFINQGAETERRGRELRLQALVNWAEATACRRRGLLSYFGETAVDEACGHCDNCQREVVAADDLTIPAQQFLSCVYRTGQLFGMSHVIDVLRGSRSQKILSRGHDQLSTYGIGEAWTKRAWQHLARQFVQQGLLEQDSEYGSLKLTAQGWQVLRGEEPFWGQLAERAPITAPAETAAYDADLFQQLRVKRKELADADGVPPYVIFSDRTLQELATYFPRSVVAFGQIHGIGQVKVSQYADIFLPLIRDYCAAHGIEERPLRTAPPPPAPRLSIGKTRTEEVGEAFAAGQSIQVLMDAYGVKRSTVVGHLTKYARAGNELPAEALRAELSLPAEAQQAALEMFASQEGEYLTPVFEALGGQVSYEDLHILRLLLWQRETSA